MIERVKNRMKEGFCNGIVFECIEFFKFVKKTMEKNYDLEEVVES